eukprot:scaffold204006_cov17-Tisochrysis_lutea.AAC.1
MAKNLQLGGVPACNPYSNCVCNMCQHAWAAKLLLPFHVARLSTHKHLYAPKNAAAHKGHTLPEPFVPLTLFQGGTQKCLCASLLTWAVPTSSPLAVEHTGAVPASLLTWAVHSSSLASTHVPKCPRARHYLGLEHTGAVLASLLTRVVTSSPPSNTHVGSKPYLGRSSSSLSDTNIQC